jgi:hypothetical protein
MGVDTARAKSAASPTAARSAASPARKTSRRATSKIWLTARVASDTRATPSGVRTAT